MHLGKPERKRYLEYTGANGRIMLKGILDWCVRVWTGLI
jgi:hypothetical protein